jgi:hypothetical protein
MLNPKKLAYKIWFIDVRFCFYNEKVFLNVFKIFFILN